MVIYDAHYADYQPPKGHPLCWLFREKPFELGYLSWGHRWYGDAPARPCLHDGWHYFVLLDGSPRLFVNERIQPMRRGTIIICHPDCSVGHFDDPGRRCEMLTWVWRTPPAHPALVPPEASYLKLKLEPAILRRLKLLHRQCREAVANANDRSVIELRVARLQLDLAVLEGRRKARPARGDFRINLAVEYLRNHLGEPDPVKHLAEYLHISDASLKRLFYEHTRKSPREFVAEWRMQWAREQLASRGASVKAVAYTLGYRHANDFSRAFKRHYGCNASDMLPRRTA